MLVEEAGFLKRYHGIVAVEDDEGITAPELSQLTSRRGCVVNGSGWMGSHPCSFGSTFNALQLDIPPRRRWNGC